MRTTGQHSAETLYLAAPDFLQLVEELLATGLNVRFRVDGSSMEPWLRAGDVACVAPCSHTRIHRGDVILYRHAGGVVLHRIVHLDGRDQSLFARGDTARGGARRIAREDLLAVLTDVMRNGRHCYRRGPLVRAFGLAPYLWRRLLRRGRRWRCAS